MDVRVVLVCVVLVLVGCAQSAPAQDTQASLNKHNQIHGYPYGFGRLPSKTLEHIKQIPKAVATPVKEPVPPPVVPAVHVPAVKRREDSAAVFSARLSNDLMGSGDVDNFVTLVFDTVDTNYPDGSYSPSTGTYEAPVTGYYSFQVSCTSPVYRNINIALNVNNNDVAFGFDNYSDYSAGSTSLSTIQMMLKGANAYVKWNNRASHGVRGSSYCTFSGAFVAADI